MYIFVTVFFRYQVPESVHLLLCVIPTYSFFYGLALLGIAVQDNDPITLTDMITFQRYGKSMSFLLLLLLVEFVVFFVAIIVIEFIKGYVDWDKYSLAALKQYLFSKKPTISYQNLQDDEDDVEMSDSASTPANDTQQVNHVDVDVQQERARMQQEDNLVRVHNVSKLFNRGKSSEKRALHQINLGIPIGQTFGLLGPNRYLLRIKCNQLVLVKPLFKAYCPE